MTPLFGHTRSVVRRNYALLEPAGFVASAAPGWTNVTLHVVVSPGMGARFSQTHVTFAEGGEGAGHTGEMEWCGYVVQGKGEVRIEDHEGLLGPGSYVFIPPQTKWELRGEAGLQVFIFEKRYQWITDKAPSMVIGKRAEIAALPFLGDPAALLQTLLPQDLMYDMAVNVFTYEPGATLPMVETHIMEHGLVMLSGQGIYRLDDEWHPVKAGDVIWMGPYCPQWFVAMGKENASYLYYKDVNRGVPL